MTAINRNNYEIFLLDYIEGKLDAAQTAALMLFLDAHPDLKEELEGLEMVQLEPNNNIRFETKEMLKKSVITSVGTINEENYEEYFVAAAEGDLHEPERITLNLFLEKNPSLVQEYETLLQCRLQPDKEVLFANKDSLKKSLIIPFITRQLYYGIAVAASLALLIGLTFLLEPGTPGQHEIAQGEIKISNTEPLENGLKPGIQHEQTPETAELETKKPDSSLEPAILQPAPVPDPVRPQIPARREYAALNSLASLPATKILYDQSLPKPSTDTKLYFSNYFTDIAIAQQIRHADEFEQEPFAERLLAQGTAVVKEIFQPGEEEFNLLPAQINLWQVADIGINGFARITGANMEFRKKTDDEGRVTSFAFESQSMQISRNLRRNK